MNIILNYIVNHTFVDVPGDPIVRKWESLGLLDDMDGRAKSEMAHIFENGARLLISKFNTDPPPGEEDFISSFFPVLRRLYSTKGYKDYERIWNEFHTFVHKYINIIEEVSLLNDDAVLWAVRAFCDEYEEGLFKTNLEIMKI